MVSDELKLIREVYHLDEYGVEVAESHLIPVLCRVGSVSQSEWFEGGRSGLNPAYKFSVFVGDYRGETACLYKGERFSIYRTYATGDIVELYVERKQGA